MTDAHDSESPTVQLSRELTRGWARVGLVTWVAVLFSDLATAITSRTVGKPPWWLGPSIDPAPIAFLALPLVLIAIPVVLFYRVNANAPRIAVVCACVLAAVAVVDIGKTPGVAVVEIAVAIAALGGSIATNAGVFTRP